MGHGRQRDHTSQAVAVRICRWTALFPFIFKKRQQDRNSALSSNYLTAALSVSLYQEYQQRENHLHRSMNIGLTSFVEHRLPFLSDEILLGLLRFRREDIFKLVDAVGWPEPQTRTKRNRYAVTPLLVTCVLLRRLASPTRWRDLEELFGLHKSQISEIFWENLLHFVSVRAGLIIQGVHKPFWSGRYGLYATAVEKKSHALENVVAFIDGTNINTSRPGGPNIDQRVMYNGHERKHCIKFQALTTPCGLAMRVAGPMEGRRHDWTLHLSSGLDSALLEALEHSGRQFVAYWDSGYSARVFLYIPFAGSNLSPEQKAFNTAMAKSRVTVEWHFREVKRYWTLLDYKGVLCLKEPAVGALYLAGILLTNLRNCIYPNIIAQYFDCAPPTLTEYLTHRTLS